MKKTLALAPITLLSAAPSRFLAKGATHKVVMEGPDRSRPRVPCKFNLWAGPGTFSTQQRFDANATGFIIDWSHLSTPELPSAFGAPQKYQVSFYSEFLFCSRRIPE
jgi:hypothetical protein